MITSSPRASAPVANSIIQAGVRCAETICTSCGTPSSLRISTAGDMKSRSLRLPMITATRARVLSGGGASLTILLLPHAGRHNKKKAMSDSPKVIVAAVDLHKGSNLVLKRALESAGSQGVVHVVCVSEPNIANVKPPEELDAPELTGVDAHKLKDLVDLRVTDYKKAFPEKPPPRAEVHTDAGDPAEKIVALAAKVDADAIIVSS